ncbi:hypothetical protein BO71DRAFT_435289 [Aspergillus ellipticus CBS 707.79]|uniref:Uncharacterized protein n=1 Tax=Aspergillus ellipticus CBS 707.79 TaxID=1448320 RepID=A0A319CWA5_9EURO|nr:hypothetical protein BO71DRAFT_435289 [Aspergillus ellipticus CBS 707.79]
MIELGSADSKFQNLLRIGHFPTYWAGAATNASILGGASASLFILEGRNRDNTVWPVGRGFLDVIDQIFCSNTLLLTLWRLANGPFCVRLECLLSRRNLAVIVRQSATVLAISGLPSLPFEWKSDGDVRITTASMKCAFVGPLHGKK